MEVSILPVSVAAWTPFQCRIFIVRQRRRRWCDFQVAIFVLIITKRTFTILLWKVYCRFCGFLLRWRSWLHFGFLFLSRTHNRCSVAQCCCRIIGTSRLGSEGDVAKSNTCIHCAGVGPTIELDASFSFLSFLFRDTYAFGFRGFDLEKYWETIIFLK